MIICGLWCMYFIQIFNFFFFSNMVFIRFTAWVVYLADYYIIIITAYTASAPSISIQLCIGCIQTRACFISVGGRPRYEQDSHSLEGPRQKPLQPQLCDLHLHLNGTSGSLRMFLCLPTTKVRKVGSDMSLHHAFIMIFPTEPQGEFQSQLARDL